MPISKRPPHPDFELLSRVLITLDQRADLGEDVMAIVAEVIDQETVLYAAAQRVLRQQGMFIGLADPGKTALWLDGFMAGADFARLKIEEP